MRDGSGRVQALCSEPSCSACLPGELAGSFQWVSAKRWWCEEHRAGREDDLEPYRSRLVLGPRGIIDLDAEAAERERQRVAAESRRHQREAREAQRREDAARLAEFEAASNEQFRRESVVHRP